MTTMAKKFKIHDMKCISCVILIEGELEDSKLVEEASCNYSSSELVVKSNKEIDERAVLNALEKIGYKATLVG